ncbi:hypothetical protein MBM09_12945 [Flaviramulus sp. BrNp1-15]|uniref:hypothetical protein n=1 Tax=Flaviramulus sp. BrNp1-15 TaxID=2916754 RepID=UPI001EE81343|nr:hypothetical protein [Flaviramulus sp. BrNp1-15]ULC58815.1 hypothetical protein MBM09_12945 [Flaviramulus sp. BrNp1-15]
MRYILLFVLVFCFSCNNEKVIKLPETNHSEITEINDISAAYLFYDETQKDSVELNRKNLISTTNWLVNVDKRLTLKQVIPHIKFLQEKKKNAGHKNENAKNYFTCHDTSKNTLGFIEFTDVVYHEEESFKYFSKISQLDSIKTIYLNSHSSKRIDLIITSNDKDFKSSNIINLKNDIINVLEVYEEPIKIILDFKQDISFQDYIFIKSILSDVNIENTTISNNEFIY